MKSRKLRVGIVGIGGVAGYAHIPSWKQIEDVEIVAMADIIPERAATAAAEHGVANVFDSHRKLIKMKEIDVVDVCTPNKAHTPIVIDALKAGKHVLCEKPLAVTPREIEKMIATAEAARRKLCVIQNHRYRAVSQAVRRWLDAGHLGEAYYGRAWAIRRNLLPTKEGFLRKDASGGGACMDIGVHCLDLAMWLMDFPEPVAVTGTTSNELAKRGNIPGGWGEWDRDIIDVESFACGMVRFANGAMLALESSWLGHTPEPENFTCTVLGDKAGVTWPSGAVCTAANGTLIDSVIQPLPMKEQGHIVEIAKFRDAVLDDGPVPVPPQQALKVIRILDGVYRSQRSGREVRLQN